MYSYAKERDSTTRALIKERNISLLLTSVKQASRFFTEVVQTGPSTQADLTEKGSAIYLLKNSREEIF